MRSSPPLVRLFYGHAFAHLHLVPDVWLVLPPRVRVSWPLWLGVHEGLAGAGPRAIWRRMTRSLGSSGVGGGGSGIGLKDRNGGGVVISSVEPSSPAVSVPVWTRLVVIDGQDATAMNKAAVINAIKTAKAKNGDVTIVFGEPDEEV